VGAEHEFGVPQERMPFARQPDTATGAFQHRRGYRRIELAQSKGKCGLSDVELFGCFLDGSELGGPIKRLELSDGNPAHQKILWIKVKTSD
jgi:hypothetical protein